VCVVVCGLENLVNEEALAHCGLSRQKQTYLITPDLLKPDNFLLPDFRSIEVFRIIVYVWRMMSKSFIKIFRLFSSLLKQILSMPSFGGEVKPSVPCRRSAACKRSQNLRGRRNLGEIIRQFLARSSTFPY